MGGAEISRPEGETLVVKLGISGSKLAPNCTFILYTSYKSSKGHQGHSKERFTKTPRGHEWYDVTDVATATYNSVTVLCRMTVVYSGDHAYDHDHV